MFGSKVNGSLVGQVLNIQRYSTHDGPGVRTTVFLKGCPLRCFWCQNPETQSMKPLLSVRHDKCVGCGRCVPKCPHGASSVVDGVVAIDRNLCTGCGACAEVGVCLADVLKIEGKSMTVDQVMKQVVRDALLYKREGGITVSGGDCEAQPEFTIELLKASHEELISTCVEITGAFPWKTVESIVEHCDYVLFDLKHMDNEKHKEGTGVPNTLILENAKKVVAMPNIKRIWFRTPLIPGYNDDADNIRETARFIREELNLVPAEALSMLPYNNLGETKYDQMGFEGIKPSGQRQDIEHLKMLKAIVESA